MLRDRVDGKVTMVTGSNRKVFAKSNDCIETPDADDSQDLHGNMHVNLAKPRPQTVVGCEPTYRRSTEGRNEGSAPVAMMGSSAGGSVG